MKDREGEKKMEEKEERKRAKNLLLPLKTPLVFM